MPRVRQSQLELPPAFGTDLRPREDAARWLRRLPALAESYLRRWQLVVVGKPRYGATALVLPVRTRAEPSPGSAPTAGPSAALKLVWPHPEAAYEALALQLWDGDGAVRVLESAPEDYVLVLEWLHPGNDLRHEPLWDALSVAARLMRRLHRPAPSSLPTQDDDVARWGRMVTEHRGARPAEPGEPSAAQYAELVPPDLVRAAARTLDALRQPGAGGILLHQDLHFENVLAAEREPWLVIDPKPVSGDPGYELAPLLWNRFEEARSAPDLAAHLHRRADLVCELAGLDRQRAGAWVLVRAVVNALAAVQDGDREFLAGSLQLARAFAS